MESFIDSLSLSTNYQNLTPLWIQQIISKLVENKIDVHLVGSSVLKILNNTDDVFDVDVEYSDLTETNPDKLYERIKKILFEFSGQSDFLTLEELPFSILRVCLADQFLELSMPRVEKFKKNDFSHKNFEAKLNPRLTPSDSFKRRDFTINSIGLKINKNSHKHNYVEIVDPFLGIDDFKNKKLNNIDNNFYKDPVRFLRLIRFKNVYDFELSESLLSKMNMFKLSDMSFYYLNKESYKSKDIIHYFKSFFDFVDNYSIDISIKLEFLRNILKVKSNKRFKSLLEFYFYLKLDNTNEIKDFEFELHGQVKNDFINDLEKELELSKKKIKVLNELSLNKIKVENARLSFFSFKEFEIIKEVLEKLGKSINNISFESHSFSIHSFKDIILKSQKNVFIADIKNIFFQSTQKSFSSNSLKDDFFYFWLAPYIGMKQLFVILYQKRVVGYLSYSLDSLSMCEYFHKRYSYYRNFQSFYNTYPAHLHINIHPDFRAFGLGSRLINELFTLLKNKNIPGVNVITDSSAKNIQFYLKNQFQINSDVMVGENKIVLMVKKI